MKRLLVLIILLSVPGLVQAQTEFPAGEWSAMTRFEGGSAAGIMSLQTVGGKISGTSAPLDENQFFPLTITGEQSKGVSTLVFSFRADEVGSIRIEETSDGLRGSGTLYGTPVELVAVPIDQPIRKPKHHVYNPDTYALQLASRDEPVLRLVPGDTVATSTLDNEGRDANQEWQAMPGNTLTGPFWVEGALPGDTLVVKLTKVRLNRDGAFMYSKMLNNAAVQNSHAQEPADGWGSDWIIDRNKGIARIEEPSDALKGFQLPVNPMVGSIGVAPPLNTALYAGDLWVHGGNIDYNRVTEGITLYFPVWRAGAFLSLGDAHALQGDGEISGQGLETSLDVEFTVDLIKGDNLGFIWSEDDESVMVHGIENSLDLALQAATTGMSRWLKREYGLNDSEIAAVLSSSIQYDVAVVVNTRPHMVARLSKDVLVMIRKNGE